MKVLVTGATGFIGRNLVKRLVDEGREVRCLVRKSSNLNLLENLRIDFVYGDILDIDSLRIATKGVSVIYHLSGAVFSRRSRDYHRINVLGTRNLLKASKINSLNKFILVSSITAVGPQKERHILLDEDTVPNPIPPYGKSKYGSERIAVRYFRRYNLPLAIVRPPLIYGPGQSNDMTDIFRKIDKGLFRIVGNGEAITSLCYIDNLIDGLLLVEGDKNSIGKLYFISDNKHYTFKEIAQTIAKELNVKLPDYKIPKFIADFSGHLYKLSHNFLGITSITLYSIKLMTLDFACDISKARKELSYHPKIDFEEGIKRTVAWYKNEFKK